MNKKGFTLVELLATIIILGLLTLIASTSVTKVLKESKGDLYKTQIKLVESAAEAWGAENIDKLPNDGECKFLTIGTLQDYGFVDKDITNTKTGEKIDNSIKIKISTKITGYGNSITDYVVNPTSVEGCSHAMPCVLVDGQVNEIGSKYECEVKPETKYNFYVLSKEDDGSTNLIMDSNINISGEAVNSNDIIDRGLVAWNSSGSTIGGPVAAIEFLYSATKDWINIPKLNYIYSDREYQGIPSNNTTIGYTSFISTNGIAVITPLSGDLTIIGTSEEPLRVRMPIYSGVFNDEGTIKTSEKGDVADKIESNSYLYDNLDSNGNTKPYGYWTLSYKFDGSSIAWYVGYDGKVNSSDVTTNTSYGVRPIINIRL